QDFYPIHWLEPHLFWLPSGFEDVLSRCGTAPFVHLWGSMFSYFGIDIHRSAPDGSFLDTIRRTSPHPLSTPELSPSEQEGTLMSIRAFLDKPWVRARGGRVLGRDLVAEFDQWRSTGRYDAVETNAVSPPAD
ncbi:MAG TPA: hypothetical protein VF701_16780, partial [Thermoanaerobaculia bacterium]